MNTEQTEAPVENNEQNGLMQFMQYKANTMMEISQRINNLSMKEKFDRKDVLIVIRMMEQGLTLQDQCTNILLQNLVAVTSELETMKEQFFQATQQTSVVTQLLMNKGTISKEEIKDTWEKDVRPKLEAQVAAMQKLQEQATAETTETTENTEEAP